MNYGEILKKSWDYIKKYKFLWLLGLLASNCIGTTFYNGGSYHLDGGKLEDIKNIDPAGLTAEIVRANVDGIGKVLGESVSDVFNDDPLAVGVVAVVLLLLFILTIYLSITSKGALIFSIDRAESGKSISLKKTWLLGKKYFWRRLSLTLQFFVLFFVPLLILSIPIIILAVYELMLPAVIFGILMLLVFVVYSVYLLFFLPYSERELFLNKKSAYNSLKSGLRIFTNNWRELILVYLIMMGISFIAGVVLAVASLIAMVLLGIISFAVYAIFPALGLLVSGFFIIAIFISLAVAGGGLSAFTSSVFTLAYRSINKKGKTFLAAK